MREFVLTLVCAGVASGIIGLVFEEDKEIMKYIKVVLSLCIVASVVSCAFSLVYKIKSIEFSPDYDMPDIEKFRQQYNEYIIEDARGKLCSDIDRVINEKVGIKPHSVNIQFVVEQKENEFFVDIKSIEIVLQKDADKKAVYDCVYTYLGVYPDVSSVKEGNF